MKLEGRPARCLVFFFFASISVYGKVYKLGGARLLNQGISLEQSSESRWKLSLTTPQFETKAFTGLPLKGDFQTLSIEGLETLQSPGEPALPYKSVIVRGHKDELKLRIKRGRLHRFREITAAPAPLSPCRCSKNKDFGPSFTLDPSSYDQRAQDLYEVVSLGDYRGEYLSKITLKPGVQTKDGLAIYDYIELMIDGRKQLDPPPIVAQNKKFLMIAPRKLESSAKKFVEYKESQGFEVFFVVFEHVASDSKSLKSYIHGLYKKEKFQYALLFGHETILPTAIVETSSNLQTPSDFPYFAMGGADDVMPDVFYGRITADKNSEVLGQLEKTIEFNERSWGDQSGLDRTLGIASNEGWQPTDVEYMRSMLEPLENDLGLTPDYFFQDDSRSRPKLINKSLNRGIRWMNYIGHGSGDSWSSINGGEYYSSHIKELKPGVVKPIIIDVACQNGRFNNAQKLGETFMNARNRGKPVGAVAYFGGSVDISWDPPAIMAMKIGRDLADQKVSELYPLILQGQFHLLKEYGDPEAAKENLLWYHLLGDPSLSVRMP